MTRRIALALGVLGLSAFAWPAGSAAAGDTPYRRTQVQPAALSALPVEQSSSPLDAITARLRGALEGGPALATPAASSPTLTGFAVDRPQPSTLMPVQYVVPSTVDAAVVPAGLIQSMPVVIGATSPATAAQGCPCTIEMWESSHGVFSADVGLCILQPRWNTNPAYRIQSVTVDNDSRQQQDFTNASDVGPMLSLAYVGCDGLGVRGRYWQLETDAESSLQNDGTLLISSATPLGLGIADATVVGTEDVRWVFESDLRIRVLDLEATQNLRWECCTFVLAAGGRLAYLSQSYDVTRTVPGATTPTLLTSGHRFRGAGPTLALAARRPIGELGLAVLAQGRGALLFGRHRQTATLATGDEMGPASSEASVSQEDLVPILELELGAQYACCWGRSHFLLQAWITGQSWLGAGNASNTDVIVGLANDNDQANLGFVGLVLSMGLDY